MLLPRAVTEEHFAVVGETLILDETALYIVDEVKAEDISDNDMILDVEIVVPHEADESDTATASTTLGPQVSSDELGAYGYGTPASLYGQPIVCAGTYHTSHQQLFKKKRNIKRDLPTVVVFLAWMYSRKNAKLPGAVILDSILRGGDSYHRVCVLAKRGRIDEHYRSRLTISDMHSVIDLKTLLSEQDMFKLHRVTFKNKIGHMMLSLPSKFDQIPLTYLFTCLKQLAAETPFAILTMRDCSLAVVKQGANYIIFNPRACDAQWGLPTTPPRGRVASMTGEDSVEMAGGCVTVVCRSISHCVEHLRQTLVAYTTAHTDVYTMDFVNFTRYVHGPNGESSHEAVDSVSTGVNSTRSVALSDRTSSELATSVMLLLWVHENTYLPSQSVMARIICAGDEYNRLCHLLKASVCQHLTIGDLYHFIDIGLLYRGKAFYLRTKPICSGARLGASDSPSNGRFTLRIIAAMGTYMVISCEDWAMALIRLPDSFALFYPRLALQGSDTLPIAASLVRCETVFDACDSIYGEIARTVHERGTGGPWRIDSVAFSHCSPSEAGTSRTTLMVNLQTRRGAS